MENSRLPLSLVFPNTNPPRTRRMYLIQWKRWVLLVYQRSITWNQREFQIKNVYCIELLRSNSDLCNGHDNRYRNVKYLYNTYSGENYSRKLQGIKTITSLTYTVGSVSDYMKKVIRQLNATIIAAGKDEISLTELTMVMFLNSLPNRFNNVRS